MKASGAMPNTMAEEKTQPNVVVIEYGSKEHENLLRAGYPDIEDRKDAQAILDDPKSSREERKNAKAFLAALGAKPTVVSTKRPWKRIRGR